MAADSDDAELAQHPLTPEMLRYLEQNRKRAGVENIQVHRLSWTDSWKGVPAADIAICSRAMSVEDLRGALEKMHRMAIDVSEMLRD